jgi:tRNA(Ile)-lysidine synthase
LHFHHRLRDEADEDLRFVETLCAELQIPLQCGAADAAEYAAGNGEGVEEAARRLRYAFLADAAGWFGGRFVATAHTADDQAETILHRILRGTGVGGLAGMPRARTLGPATLIRPMLGFRRTEALMYLSDLGQTYRDDASNFDCRFTRNRLRHELMPLLARQFNPRVEEALLRLGRLAGEVQQVVAEQVETLLERAAAFPSGEQAILDRRGLLGQPRHLLRELLIRIWRRQGWPRQAMGGAQWEQLADLLLDGGPRQTFPGAILAEVVEDALHLTRLPR